jgi:rhodanese-related sulfurtransferase
MRYLSLILILYFIASSTCEQYKNLDGKAIKGLLTKKNINIIDTREPDISSQGYLPNSLLIPLSMDYSKWMTTVVRRGSEVIIISDKDNFGRAIQKAKEAGYKIFGYAIYDEIVKHVSFAIQKALYKENTKESVEKLVKEKKYILDLREAEEYKETGIVENSKLIPLSTLNRKIKKLPKNGEIYLFCKTGGRALMAMSFLKRARVKSKLYIMRGGITKTIEEGFALVKSTGSNKEK